jgi:hypothetical protein
LLLPAVVTVLCLLPAAAHADPVVVTGGSISTTYVRGAFRTETGDITGTGGFALRLNEPDGGNHATPAACTDGPCAPGTVVNLANGTLSLTTFPAFGAATIPGAGTYSPILVFGTLNFSAADVIVPDLTLSTVTVSTPFTLGGTIQILGFDQSSGTFVPVFNDTLTGQGLLSLTFVQVAGGYSLRTYQFQFSPAAVPEPATLTLLGAGLVGAYLGARRRRVGG